MYSLICVFFFFSAQTDSGVRFQDNHGCHWKSLLLAKSYIENTGKLRNPAGITNLACYIRMIVCCDKYGAPQTTTHQNDHKTALYKMRWYDRIHLWVLPELGLNLSDVCVLVVSGVRNRVRLFRA